MENKRRVFILNQHTEKKYDDAEKFGELVPLSVGSQPVFQTDFLIRELEDGLKKYKFNPAEDFLLLSGPGIMNFYLGFLVAKYKKNIRVLMFNISTKKYIVRLIKGEKNG